MGRGGSRLQGVRTKISCIACRARRKGCDYRKPNCSRCERLGTRCEYQTRQYMFVEVKTAASTTSTVSSASSSRQQSKSPSIHSNDSLLATNRSQVMIEAFWATMLPSEGQGVDGSMGGMFSAPWVPVIRTIASIHGYVHKALEACAYAAVGWANNDNILVLSASLPYMSALRDVNSALKVAEHATSDAVLAGCRLLSLFEMLRKLPVTGGQSVQLTGWQTHAAGAFQLLHLRGRSQHTTPMGHQLYDGVRIMGVMQGVGQRKANGFTKLQWHLPRHDLRDELFDLLGTVPALLEATDQLMSRSVSNDTLRQGEELMQRYITIAEALRSWEESAVLLCRSSAPTICTEDITAYGYAFFFVCEQYWAACLGTYSSCQALTTYIRSLNTDALLLILDWINAEPFANNILRTAKHFFAPNAGLWAAQGAVFPLSSVLVYLLRSGRRGSPEFSSIIELLQCNRSGAVMADFIQMVMAQGT